MLSLNVIRDAQTRLLAKPSVATVANPWAEPWKILPELDGIGVGTRPIVINGGFTTREGYYDPLVRLLKDKGFDVSVAHHKAHGLAPLQSDAGGLQSKVAAAATRSSDGKVTVIGHSMGGLSARYLMQRLGGYEQVGQLITIGTPHNGHAPYGLQLTERIGRWTGLQALRQLGRGSDELVDLNDDLPQFMEGAQWHDPNFRVVSVIGDMDAPGLRRTDGLVSVESAMLDDALDGVSNVVHRGLGAHHGGIAGQFGMHDPTMRSVLMLAAGRDVADAAAGAAYATAV